MEINSVYLENLLSDMLNNDELSDELEDDSTAITIVGISLLEFADQDGNSWYLKGDEL